MVVEDSPEGLPQGWSLKFDDLKSGRKVKYYKNSRTGQKFYSKDDLMRYVKAQNPQLDEPRPTESPVERPSNNNQMHLMEFTNDHPEWLPHGWIMELKTRKYGRVYKCYVDPSTGCKFYSKPEVFRYIKNVKQKGSTSKQKEMPISNIPASKLIEYSNEEPEWLPHGWNVELKTVKSGSASGKMYKCYVDPSTGHKFFSKPQVFRYLKSVKQKSSSSKRKEVLMSMVPTSKVTTEKSTVEDLPPGWIKEIKIRKTAYGIKKDPLYTDPVSGYVFRSKRDVQRYLETGDISSCAILPKKRAIEEKILVDVNLTPPSATKRQKVEHPVARHQLVGGDGSSDLGSMASSRSYSLRKRTKTISALTTMPIPMTTEISSQRNPTNDDAESKENSGKNWSAPPKAEDLERNEDRNVSADGGLGHSFVEDDSRQDQNPDSRIKNEERCPAQNSLSKSKHQKWLNLPRRRSKRLAGDEPDMVMNSLSVVQLNSEVDKKQGWNSGNGTEAVGSCEMKIQNRLTISKKALNLPLRFSKRLAGVQPDPFANSVSIVQALPKTVRTPNNEATLAVDLNKGVLAQYEPRKELLLHSSSDTNNALLGDPSNESQGCDTISPMLTIAESSGRSQVKMINAENLPVITPEADVEQEKNCLENEKTQKSQVRTENNLRASRKKKEFNVPCRSSKRLACIEPEMKENSVSVPDGLADEVVGVASFLGKTSISFSGIDASCHEEANGEGDDPSQAREKRTRFNLEQLKTLEKNFELGNNPEPERRMQLARALGLQPRQVTVWFQNRRAKLKKEQLEKERDLLKRQLEAVHDQNQKFHGEAERGLETPSPLHGELSNKNQPFVDAYAGSKDELQMVEVSKSHDKRSELEFIPPLGEILSDPCLEFAFKTLTGELPVEAASVNGPVSTPAADIIGERNLTTKKLGKSIKGKAPVNSRKSKTAKKLSLPDEALEFQPEPVASPIIYSRAFKHSARVSNKTGAVLGTGLAPYSSAVAPETEQAHHPYVNVKTIPQNDPSNNRWSCGEHLQLQQVSDKLEQRPFVSFDYWSDPCFDSAFKTLTGSTPVDDNVPVKSYFQQQVEPSQIQREGCLQQQSEISQSPRDVSSTLPDFGLPSFFQTDISVHFDSPEKRLSSQPPIPMSNHSSLFSGSVSFSSCNSIGSQPPPLVKKNQTPPQIKKNRGRPRKVNS